LIRSEILGITENESEYTSADTADDPTKLIDVKINCRDTRSGQIVEYLVVDYMQSAVGGGDHFLLEDRQGQRKIVTVDELAKIRLP
jgi:hypothetical protein